MQIFPYIALDRKERILVSVTTSGILRVWNLADLNLIRKKRLILKELKPRNTSKYRISSFDIHPSGKMIAIGFSALKIKSFQIESFVIFLGIDHLDIVGRIKRLKDPISRVLFSKSGRYLLLTTFQEYKGGCIYVYELKKTSNQRVSAFRLMKDDDYFEWPKGADFDLNGRLIIVGDRWEESIGIMHLYNKRFKLIAFEGLPEKEDYVIPDVKFSPDGKLFAVVYGLSPNVDVFANSDLSLCYSAPTQKPSINFSCVCWSKTGDNLYASGKSLIKKPMKEKNGKIFYYDEASGYNIVRKWPNAGRGKAIDYKILNAEDMIIRILGNRDIIYGDSKGNIGIVSDQGDVLSVMK